jgi:site-specific DNA-methyltransferase (adenine-specific)
MKPYYDEDGITIYHGDCREILPSLPECDLLLTDPPYGSGLSVDYADRFSPAARPEWWRTSKDRKLSVRHVPIHGDSEPFNPSHLVSHHTRVLVLWGGNWYASRLADSGAWWVWDKRNGKRDVSEAEWPMSEVELAWTNKGKGARIFRHTWFGLIRDSEYGEHFHPTQKPAALMCWCMEQANAAGLVIDPYCGSGPTLVAAKGKGLEAIGVEIEEKYCEIAAKRLAQKVLAFK